MSGPSPHDLALEGHLLDLQVHFFALRAAVQAVIAAAPPPPRALVEFDAIAARLLSQIALDMAQRPETAARKHQQELRERLAGWRAYLEKPPGD